MADNTTITPEQLARAIELRNALIDTTTATAELVATNSEFAEILEKQLGTQQKYATEEEKRLELAKQVADFDRDRLERQQDFVNLQAKQNAATITLTELEKERLNAYTLQADQLSEGYDSIEEAIAAQKKLVKETEKYIDKLDKVVGIQNQAEEISANRLRQAGLLADKSGDIADAFIDARQAGVGLSKVIEGSAKSMSKVFTKVNMAKTLKNNLKDLGETARANMFSVDGLLMQYEQLGEEFAQSTGLSQKYGKEIQSLTLSMNDQHFAMEETNRAYETLATQAKSFTDLNEAGRAALTEQALQFSRLGVSADTFAAAIDNLGKTFGQTPEQINKTTEEMSNFARELGVGPNKMLEDFNKQLPLLARYGEKQGAQMFRELAYTAKKAGIEMEDLVGIAKTFDTFEGAAEAAGKLNFMLGGPLLNSIDLINANETERIQILKDSLRESGKSFEQMGRFEKDLIAQTLNVDTAVAQKLFSNTNLKSIKDATAAIQNQAKGVGSLGSQAEKTTTLAQKQKAAAEAQLRTMKDLGPVMKDFHELVIQVQKALAGWAPIILVITMAIKGMYGAWVAVQAIATAMGMTVGAVLGPIILAVGAIIAVLAILYTNWDNIQEFMRNSIGWITDGISDLINWFVKIPENLIRMMGNLAKGFIGLLADIIFFLPMAVAKAVDGLTGKAADLSSYIPGLDVEGTNWAAGVGNLKARIVADFAGFEDGVTNYTPGLYEGMSLVGEAGPELVTLPRGSNVITNENTNRLMGENKAGPASTSKVEQTLNITLELDGDVLSKHTRKIAFDTMKQALSLPS